MFDVIDFLESVGQDAQWREAGTESRAAAMADAQIAPALRAAMLAGDAQGLQDLLGQKVFCCYISPAKEDEGDEDKKKDKDQKDKKDHKDGGDQGGVKQKSTKKHKE